MKIFFSLIMVTMLGASPAWLTNLEAARQQAQKDHKCILLNFSGSDWCGPCIRMHREIFGSDAFGTLAAERLVLVNADFPRLKKNQLRAVQQQANNEMADTYNPKGIFPYTVLLNAEGKKIKDWEGWPNMKAAAFCEEVQQAITAQ